MLVKNNLLTGATLALVVAMVGSPNTSGAQEAARPAPRVPAPVASRSVDQSAGMPASAEHRSAAYGAWGFDDSGVDPKSNPGDSFFDFASGIWHARTGIPADKFRFGVFDAVEEKTLEQVRAIIESAAKSPSPNTDGGKIGALYSAFMDEARIEQLDLAPIAGDLAEIRRARTKADIAVLMGRARGGFGGSFFFVTVAEDEKDPTRNTLHASQAGLGLPDRDYYLRDAFKDKKAKYREYVARMLDMAGWAEAQQRAGEILALEMRIAEASWSRAESRDRDKTYNPLTPAELDAYAPGFPWSAWLAAAEVGGAHSIVVRQNTAFPKLAKIFAETPLETLQAWQAFRVVDQTAPFLSERFVKAQFDFRATELAGQPEPRQRWKRATLLVNSSLGEAVGKEYVAHHFPAESKAKMEELVGQLKLALRGRIENLPWMTPETKVKALEKLDLFGVKIGYPNKWRDYSALEIDPADLVGNIRRSTAFRWAYAVAKLDKPVDPDEWGMTPQTVNAYYSATHNEIVFPAGILQPPFFDPNADMAVNYGGIGGVIGHELTHGFDDQGRKYDGHGVLTQWWQPADTAKFQSEAAKYGAQYDTYAVAPGVNVKGAQTMGENIADLGGILLALDAYRASLHGQPAPVLDGYTGEQRVFLGWAQVWRAKYRPEALKQQTTIDSHSPPRFRVDGPLRNVDAWYDAFGVKPGDKLYLKPDDRVRIW
jgi:putative endopeptidase